LGHDVGSTGTLTEGEITAALAALGNSAARVPARSWPGSLTGLDQPGLYAWWVDLSGAAMLSVSLGAEVAAGRIYAGQAGATAWPSGTRRVATLRSRIGGNHIRGSVRGSTFRLTLAAVLRGPLELKVAGPRKLDSGSEQRLTTWILTHLEVAVHPFPDADRLGDLARSVLSSLDPPREPGGDALDLPADPTVRTSARHRNGRVARWMRAAAEATDRRVPHGYAGGQRRPGTSASSSPADGRRSTTTRSGRRAERLRLQPCSRSWRSSAASRCSARRLLVGAPVLLSMAGTVIVSMSERSLVERVSSLSGVVVRSRMAAGWVGGQGGAHGQLVGHGRLVEDGAWVRCR
jgi:hypothetical protein